jgi:heptosyltransferase-1
MRILLIRTSALGDVVHCLPVLTALRRHRPEARIGWVVESSMAPLLEGHADLDVILPVRLRAWRKRALAPRTLREVAQFVGRLRAFSPDVVIDLMGNHKAGAYLIR